VDTMILIKAGGSAITDKKVPFSVKDEALAELAAALRDTEEDVVLCHGGGSFGHPLAARYNVRGAITTKAQREGVARINVAMRTLSNVVCEALNEGGIGAFALQTSAVMTTRNGIIDWCNDDLIRTTVQKGFVPVLYGDAVHDATLSFSILSGDQIMLHLARTFPGSRAIFLTDVGGIYTTDPKEDADARRIDHVTFGRLPFIEAGGSGDATGGMRGKLEEIARFGDAIEMVDITSLGEPGALARTLRGEHVGTRITR